MNNLINALLFIVTTIFGLYIAAVLLRVILQYIRAPFSNPISQFIVKITNPGFKILRKIIPGFMGIDFAGIIFAVLLAVFELFLINSLRYGALVFNYNFFITSLFVLLSSILSIYFWAIIIRVISSFMAQGYQLNQNPLFGLTYLITEPVLKPIRNMMPSIAGFDLSPLIACLIITVLRILFNVS